MNQRDGSLVPACQQGDPKVGEHDRLRSKGLVMRYYFLALGTLVVVCFGCHLDGQHLIDKGEYVAPPAAMLQRPGPMVDLPHPAIFPPMGPAQARSFQSATTQVRFVEIGGIERSVGKARRVIDKRPR